MDFEVPGDYKLVDHALSRVARRGCMSVVRAEGEGNPELFDPDPNCGVAVTPRRSRGAESRLIARPGNRGDGREYGPEIAVTRDLGYEAGS